MAKLIEIDSRSFRERVQVGTPATTQGSWGHVDKTTATYDATNRKASIIPLQGRELFQAQQVNARAQVRIRMRYFAGLTSVKRIKRMVDSTVFEILEPPRNIDTRNRVWEFMAARHVD